MKASSVFKKGKERNLNLKRAETTTNDEKKLKTGTNQNER